MTGPALQTEEARFAHWAGLAARTCQADPFCCSPAWQFSFHEAFGPLRPLLLQESPGGMLAFAERVFSPRLVCLTPLESHWFFGCPLLGPEAVDLLAGALPLLARHYHPLFPKIVISGVRPRGALLARLKKTFGPGFRLLRQGGGVQCGASLAGGLDGFLSRRSGERRRKLAKSRRLAAGLDLAFERVSPASPEEAAFAFERILAVERTSWKGLAGCGMSEEPSAGFYAVLLRRLARTRSARIIFARQEGRDVGFIFGALAGRIYRGQQFSYDQALARLSIGNLLQAEQVRWLCEEGAARYDMGPLTGPGMEYKAHWTEQRFPIETWILDRE